MDGDNDDMNFEESDRADESEESEGLDTNWYEDDDDRAAFESSYITRSDYESEFLPLKNNSEDFHRFFCYHQDLSDVAWERIGLFLNSNTNLKGLRIIECNLTATRMASLFNRHIESALEEITLNGNPIGMEGIRILAPHLRGNLSLTHLHLSITNLDPEAAALLAEALPVGSKLEHLALSNNTIGNAGVTSLSSALNMCAPHLESLFLDHTGIGKDGCYALAQLLSKSHSSLTVLYLDDNEINDDCARVLADALKNNRTLMELCLSKNAQITDTGWSCFLDLVSDTASFTSLCQSNHTLRDVGLGRSHSMVQCVRGSLSRALGINRKESDNNKAGMEKIREFVRGKLGEFNPKPLVGVDTKMIPHVFGWINRECKADDGWNAVYRILRDLPSLHELVLGSPGGGRRGSFLEKEFCKVQRV